MTENDARLHFERLGFRYYPQVVVHEQDRSAVDRCINNLLQFKETRSTRSQGPVPFKAKYGTECWLASNAFNRAVLSDESILQCQPESCLRQRATLSLRNTSAQMSADDAIVKIKQQYGIDDTLQRSKVIKVWDRTPADSYKNGIPETTPLFEDHPAIRKLDYLARTLLGDADLAKEKLYLVQVVKYSESTSRGCHQDDLPNAGHMIVGYTAGDRNRCLELIDYSAHLSWKITLEPGSMYIMKNSARYGSKLPADKYGHGKIEHDATGAATVLVMRYGTPRPHEVPVPMTRDSLDLNYKTRMSFINGMGNKRRIVIDDDNDNDDDDVDDDVTSSSRRLAKTYPDSPILKKNRILLERYHHGV